ncbi:MAG: nicotinate (nicotinamide) nucleotide adenylyltransferase [Ruminiclostridium sp.]|jgi:nicotinate-nucleotide adenylyltransferase|nr:nicotinate (nicotinamide) nucleotide adenylyltransferase [Ruminiclostridium sp.]
MKRVGIFGGAFDPPHIGHERLAALCCERLGLEELLIVPTFRSPHKPTPLTDYEHRLNMCRAVFNKKIYTVSDMERQIDGEGYTITLIRRLKDVYPKDTKFFLIIGGDMLFSFEKWYKYESILKECSVTAAAREDDSYADMLEYAAELGRIKVLNLPVTDISSTEIREKLKKVESVEGLLSQAVSDYIKEHCLYGQETERQV